MILRRLLPLALLGIGACGIPTCASRGAPPATVGASATAPVATAVVPGAHCGIEGKWCMDDVPAPDPAFAPVETLNLPLALWGVDAPNLLKSITVVWDGVGQRLYAVGIANDRLMVIDPAVGRPTGAVDLDVKGHHTALLRVDEARRKLWRVDKADGAIRVVDLDRGEVVATREGTRMERPGEGGRGYPIRDAAVDPATGWLWVANLEGGTLTGYSPDLRQEKVAAGLTGPASIEALADDLLVVDGASRTSMRMVRYKPSTDSITTESPLPRAAGPTNVNLAPDGTVIMGGRVLAALGADGLPKWTRPLGGMSEAVVFVGDTVAVLVGEGADAPGAAEGGGAGGERPARGDRPEGGDRPPRGERPEGEGGGKRGGGAPRGGGGGGGGGGPRGGPPSESVDAPAGNEGPERHLLLFDLATGTPKGDVTVGFEARSAVADAAGGRVFVANGGDASVSVVDLATATIVRTLDVGSAAEHVVVDAKTGDRYVLDRLGGSRIYRWRKGATTVDSWAAGRWPSDVAVDSGQRRLWALGHYDAEVLGWDLDAGTPLAPLSLGLPKNASDTLGDLDFDPAVGIGAVVFPETGGLAVVDPGAGKVLWSRTEPSLAAGSKAGPGNAFVAVDGKRDRLYVVADRGRRVLAFGLRDGAPKGELALPEATAKTGEAYNVDGAWLDRAGGRLFVGPQVVTVPALAVGPRIEGIGKVFWTDADRILALAAGSEREPERLVELDPKTFAARTSRPLVRTGMMRLNPSYDPAARRVYAADMAEARVLAWDWPR
ncbi:MAG: hypothetical protein Q8P41_15475 [Pseudomonadota bacterium]|nr:hypothetical protein [Pseudomonadota bacterium]